jgi:hypothetical protein
MKCACSSASGMIGWLGVLVIVAAMILRVRMGQGITLWGIHTCASHLLLVANTLILLAIFLRHQGTSEQK